MASETMRTATGFFMTAFSEVANNAEKRGRREAERRWLSQSSCLRAVCGYVLPLSW
jgi:hypothetical protein